ncbi:MAG: GtrA family protein [Betaproteobacteria bacterium]|nr:GtrA family protein [Betaproteobacteria bacterium]
MIRQFLSRQFLLFLLTGGVAALVNFGSRILYSRWLDFSPAIVLAYLTGMATAFLLARIFVFRQSNSSVHRSVFFFCLVNLVAGLQTWAISIALAGYLLPALGVRAHILEIAHAAGIVFPVFTSYLGHKYWSFR